MRPFIQQINKSKGLLGYLSLLTLFFVLLEISLFIQGRDIYLSDFKLIASRLTIPAGVVPELLYFFFIQFVVHAAFVLLVWSVTVLIASAFNFSAQREDKLGFGLWILAILMVFFGNHHFFPNSKFACVIDYVFPFLLSEIVFYICASLTWVACLTAAWSLIVMMPRYVLAVVGAMIVSLGSYHHFKSIPVVDAATSRQPNIIFIGIDSLRPDFLGYFGYEKQTPHLDDFFNHSTVFANSLTPLARTFPAWVSILTGRYPKKTQVRFDLAQTNGSNWSEALPNVLRSQGYETIFATDETRFSNIDGTFGFDKTVTPPVGFNDFLFGNLNDFPLTNLLVNTGAGKYLFPHSYANRPVFNTYDPDSFIRLITPELLRERTKPLFFAVHFCLPHFPYIWGDHSADDNFLRNYQAAVHRSDQQFQDFLTLLKQSKMLDHAIVVVLSDHGEALELNGDRVTAPDLFVAGAQNPKKVIPHFYPPSLDKETVDQAAGHGTDVLSLTQYHTVLAVRLFGMKNSAAMVSDRVSLLDIKPTVLDFLHESVSAAHDGVSLKSVILGDKSSVHESQDFFMESDFSPQAVRTVHPETRALLFEGIDYFQVDPVTAQIRVKDSMAKLIISSKQYADVRGDWILALYPQKNRVMVPILVNLHNGKWTNDLHSPFAQSSPALSMLQHLKQFYGKDIPNECRRF